jgi:hypothetical protein
MGVRSEKSGVKKVDAEHQLFLLHFFQNTLTNSCHPPKIATTTC